MLTMGSINPVMWKDNWTVVTEDGSLSAQFEHTILITSGGAEIMTQCWQVLTINVFAYYWDAIDLIASRFRSTFLLEIIQGIKSMCQMSNSVVLFLYYIYEQCYLLWRTCTRIIIMHTNRGFDQQSFGLGEVVVIIWKSDMLPFRICVFLVNLLS